MITPEEREIRTAIADHEIALDAISLNPRPWPLFTDGPRVIALGASLGRLRQHLAVVRVLAEGLTS